MKKLKIGLLIAVLSLVVGAGSAFAADLNFTNDTNVSIGGHNYTVVAGSVATASLILTATNLTVTVPAGVGSLFTIKSPDGYALGSTGNIVQSCSGGANVLTIAAGLGPIVITPNPASALCTGVVVTASGSGGLTSGGGTSTPPPATSTPIVTPPTIVVTPVTPSVGTIPGCGNSTSGFSTVSGVSCLNNAVINTVVIPGCNGTLGFSTATGQSCVNNFATSTSVVISGCDNGTSGFSTVSGVSCLNNSAASNVPGEDMFPKSYDFGTTTLKSGSSGAAVEELQEFLNRFLSLGLVLDGKLGPKTVAVIKKWQSDNGLVADGLVGAKTKALMNSWAATR